MKNTNSFQLFVIIHDFSIEVEKSILQFLEMGVSGIYLRNENLSSEFISNISKKIDPVFHQNIIIPFSCYDQDIFDTHKFIIHFKEKERTTENFSRVSADAILSTSIHNLSEGEKLPDKFKIVFYSPVFESISKPNYKPKISLEELTLNIKHQTINNKQLIALGGINEQNILQIKDAGFDGAALLGSVWKSDKPIEAFKKIKMQLMK